MEFKCNTLCVFGFCFLCCIQLYAEGSKTAFTSGVSIPTASTSDYDMGHSKNLAAAIDCVFSSGTCYWKQSYNDTFDWTLGSGSTPSTGTGPSGDHTGTGTRQYMFIEASAPRRSGDYAILASHRLEPKNHQRMCISFWYHMYGTNIGTLAIYNERLLETHTDLVEVWSEHGNKGNIWFKGEASIDPPGPMRILINATVGGGYEGDIAIDDLSLSVANCTQQSASALVG